MAAPRVLVVGSFNLDHAWATDALPAPGATRLGRYACGPGGKGFNQAVAAARAGAPTAFLAALGEDDAAARARALAADDGITLLAETIADEPSGSAGIFVDADGRNVIVVAPGANARLSVAHVRAHAAAFDAARVVLVQLEVAGDAVQAALDEARRRGRLAILNPAPANAPTTPALLAAADVLTPNETEFAALLARHAGVELDGDGLHARDDAGLHRLCQSLRPATWVITLGARGAFVSHAPGQRRGDEAEAYRVPAAPATAIDTTGAGDAFNGALAAALAAEPGAPFHHAAVRASRYAARSTETRGAADAMPRGLPALD